MYHYIKKLSIAMLAALALTACEDDPTVINPDPGNPSTAPDEDAALKAILSSAFCPDNDIVIFNIGDPDAVDRDPSDVGRSDKVKVILTKPLDHDVTLRIGLDPDYANGTTTYYTNSNFKNEHFYNITDTDKNYNPLGPHFSIEGSDESFVSIKAGQKESDELTITFSRSDLRSDFSYLFPVRVTDTSTGELYAQTYYVVSPIEETISEIGERPAVFVAYVDTEVMNPLVADKFVHELSIENFITGDNNIIYRGPLFEILNIRTATITDNAGKPALSLTSDLEYILKNRAKYLAPMQNNGLKVCLCIKGGGSGLGFSNMTDKQITDFVVQIKSVVSIYDLDGVNLWDENAGYDKDGAAQVSAESYAKLIKEIKRAMPDKLLTLVDTRETTEALCDPVAGISIGDYLDYAWSSLEDFIAPYEPNAEYRPLANMPEKKYGTIFMRDFGAAIGLSIELESNPLVGGYLTLTKYTPLSGTDVFALYDIMFKDYGTDAVWQEMTSLWTFARYPVPEDFSSFPFNTISWPRYMFDYYAFKKDW